MTDDERRDQDFEDFMDAYLNRPWEVFPLPDHPTAADEFKEWLLRKD